MCLFVPKCCLVSSSWLVRLSVCMSGYETFAIVVVRKTNINLTKLTTFSCDTTADYYYYCGVAFALNE